MKPPKKGYSTYPRPLFRFAMDAITSTDGQGNPYIAPDAISPVDPFRAGAHSIILPYLYHAGTAWALSGTLVPPASDEAFDSGGNGGISLAYQPMPETRPWGRAGRLIRSPRSVVIVSDTLGTGDGALALLGAGVGATAETAKASVVLCGPDQGISALTSWAPRNLDRTGIASPTSASPIPATCWLGGDILAVVMTSNAYFGHSSIIQSSDGATYTGAGWDVYSPVLHSGNNTGSAVAVDRTTISAARAYWSTLMGRVARFAGLALYDPFTGTDDPFPTAFTARNSDYYAKYDPTTLFTDVTDSLSPAWSRASVTDLRTSPTLGASAVSAAIAAFWPDEFD